MRELREQIQNRSLNGAYLFYGEEKYLIRLYLDMILGALFENEDERLLNYSVLDEPKNIPDIISTLETLPFLAEKRLVVIKNSGAFVPGDDFETLANAVAGLESTVAVFVEEKVNKTSKMYKTVAKVGRAVEFAVQSEQDLGKWIVREAARDSVNMSGAVAAYLISFVGTDMTNIMSQWSKLRAYLGDKTEVTNEDINAICTPDIRDKIYDIINAISNKKAATALKSYSELISRHTAPQQVLYSIIGQFRNLLRVCLLTKEGKNGAAISDILDVSTGRAAFLIKEAKRFGEETLRNILEELLETDAASKNGNIDANDVCLIFIMKYAS